MKDQKLYGRNGKRVGRFIDGSPLFIRLACSVVLCDILGETDDEFAGLLDYRRQWDDTW